MNLEQLKKQNREKASTEQISLMELTSEKDYGVAITYKNLDEITTTSYQAGVRDAIDVIKEVPAFTSSGLVDRKGTLQALSALIKE